MLGYVQDIKSSELIVSLPGLGNFGHVRLANISRVYTDTLAAKIDDNNNDDAPAAASLLDMYSKGDLVRCKVLAFVDKKLMLSIAPEHVNAACSSSGSGHLVEGVVMSGAVKSREDHGYTVDLGLASTTAFCRLDTTTTRLHIGQTRLFRVGAHKGKGKANSASIVPLHLCDPASESVFYDAMETTDGGARLQFDALLPGARLSGCVVDKVGRNGLQLGVAGLHATQLIAYVHSTHVPSARRSLLLKSVEPTEDDQVEADAAAAAKLKSSGGASFSSGDRLESATIVFINPYAKLVYLSLLPHLLDSTKAAKCTTLFTHSDQQQLQPVATKTKTKTSDSTSSSSELPQLKIGAIVSDAQISSHTLKGIYVKFRATTVQANGGKGPLEIKTNKRIK